MENFSFNTNEYFKVSLIIYGFTMKLSSNKVEQYNKNGNITTMNDLLKLKKSILTLSSGCVYGVIASICA